MAADTHTAPPAWSGLAGRALTLAMSGQTDRAVNVVKRIAIEHGTGQMPWVVIAWIDAMLAARARIDGGVQAGQSVKLGFVHAETGRRDDATGVPLDVAWAGQAIAARAADDEDMYRALVESCDDNNWGCCVAATLDVCATNIVADMRGPGDAP